VNQRKTASRLALTMVAMAALLLAHWAAYVLAYRDIGLRVIVLAQSGHSYLTTVSKLSLIFVLIGFAWIAIAAWDRRTPAGGGSLRFRAVALRLGGIQLIGFSVLEVVERLLVHAPVMEMFSHYTYVLGLLMQVVTALAAAVVILLLARTVRQVASLIATRRWPTLRANTFGRTPLVSAVALRRGLVGATGVRGPPHASGF
jgi:hypothetical protein